MLHEEILQAMGVELLRPRFLFSNAAAEDLQAYKQVKPALESSSSQPADSDQVNTGLGARQALLDEISQLDGQHLAAGKNKSAGLRLRLRLVRLDQCIMLLDQPQLQWQEEQLALRFFADIYYALHNRAPQQWQQAVFEWPPRKNFPVDDESKQLRQLLQSYIQQMLQSQSAATILIWGDIGTALLEQPLPVGNTTDLGGQKVLQLQTLTHYWQQAGEKRVLWQQLQSLIAE